jgi:hypothetical protein
VSVVATVFSLFGFVRAGKPVLRAEYKAVNRRDSSGENPVSGW